MLYLSFSTSLLLVRIGIVLVPLLLTKRLLGAQSATFWWVRHQDDVTHLLGGRWPFLNLTFPLYFAQNVLTTGLIVYKIYSQHRIGKAAGLVPLNTPSLVSIMRIIIESAAIYTAGTLVVVVLRALDHPARLLMHAILAPTTGTSHQSVLRRSSIDYAARYRFRAHDRSYSLRSA